MPPEPASLSALPGDRVVVRYRLGQFSPADWRSSPNPRPADPAGTASGVSSTGFAQSDVTGRLIDDGDPLRLDRDGEVVSIPRGAVTSVRLLSATPVRNSDIRSLEHAAALAWPGPDNAWVGGWMLRAGHGISRRANSAVPLDRSPRADGTTLGAIESWYRTRGLPPLLALPERLLPSQIAGHQNGGEVHTLTRELIDVAEPTHATGPAVTLSDSPSSRWLHAYLGDEINLAAAHAVLSAHQGGVVRFAQIEQDGAPIAIGRAAVTDSPDHTTWLGVTALWTTPSRRRGHLGDAVLGELLSWGAGVGAGRAYVQVEADNRIAGRWYRSRGFGLHHRTRYLTPSGAA